MKIKTETKSIPKTHEVPSTKKRILLFFGTYMVGVLITTAIIAARIVLDRLSFPNGFSERIAGIFSAITLVLPIGFVLAVEWVLQDVFGLSTILVSGLHIPSPENPIDTPLQAASQGLAYFLFLSVSIIGILTKNQRIFRNLYYVFMGLLIIAISGCMRLQ